MDELIKVVVDDSASTDALNRIANAGDRADKSINKLGKTIDQSTQSTKAATGAATTNATAVNSQTSAFQRLQSLVTGTYSSFQRLASFVSGSASTAFSRLQSAAASAFTSIVSYLNNASGALNNFSRNLNQNQRSMDNLWRLTAATAAANVLGAFWDRATAAISGYIDRMTEVQRTMSLLTVVTPTGQQGEYDYMMQTADKYGVRIASLAGNYSKLAIAAREANVPQETMRRLFEGTAIGARVMHQSTSQVDLTFQALTQMLSKGVVSMEELRRQFAERMPGAIHAVAKELGVTYDALTKFIGEGKALSDKFMPYIANALVNSFGKGIGAASTALDAELNRIHNSFDKFFKQVYDQGGAEGPAGAIRALNEKLNNPEIAKSFAAWVDSISKEVTRFIKSITMDDIEKGANTFIGVLKAIGDMAVFAAKSIKWLSENMTIVGGLLGAYMGAKIGFMVAGPPGMAVGAAIGGLGGAAGGYAMGGSSSQGGNQALQTGKTNSQIMMENQLRLQASGSPTGTQFNKADLDLLSGLPSLTIKQLVPEIPKLPKVGENGATLDNLLGGGDGGKGPTKSEINAANRELEKQQELLAKLNGLNKDFTEEWNRLNTIFNSPANKDKKILPLEGLISAQQQLLEQQPFMKAIRKDEENSTKRLVKEMDEYNKEQDKILEDRIKLADKAEEQATKLEDEAKAWNYAKAAGTDLATGIEMMAEARAKDNYQKAVSEGADGATLLALQRELEARNRILEQTKINDRVQQADDAARKMARSQARYWDDVYQEIDATGKSIFRSLVTEGENAFDAIGDKIQTSVIDLLYEMTAKKWLISIGTELFGSDFASAAAREMGGGAGGGGIGGIMNAISTGYSALTGGLANSISNAFSNFAMSSTGQSLGLSSVAADGMGPPALTNMGSNLGSAAGMIGSGLAGYGISSAISGGYSTGGNTVNAIAGIASAFFGPIAGVIGGLINRAFGRKLKDTGIQGTFGGEAGFEGEGYQFYKGGWLRSDKTKTSELDSGLQKMLSDSFKVMQIQVGTFSTILGLSSDKIAGFTTSMKVSLQGLNEEEIQDKIQEALATANNELAEQVLGTWVTTTRQITEQVYNMAGHWDSGVSSYEIVTRTIEESTYAASEYAKEGEKAIDTLSRLASSLVTVRELAADMRVPFEWAGLAGADAASKIADAFGGLEAMVEQVSSYIDSYYTDIEKRQNLARRASEALSGVGFEVSEYDILNASKPIVRGFVDAVLQEFGPSSPQYVAAIQQANLIASLYEPIGSTSDKAKEMADALKDAASTASSLANSLDQAYRARDKTGELMDKLAGAAGYDGNAYGRIREARLWGQMQGASYDQQIKMAEELTGIVLSRYEIEKSAAEDQLEFVKSLRAYVDSLTTGALSPLTNKQKLEEAGRQFYDTYNKAIAGDETAKSVLQDKSGTFIELARNYYASSQDFRNIFSDVTGLLSNFPDLASQSEDAAKESLKQMHQLYDILEKAYKEADVQVDRQTTLLIDQLTILATMEGGVAEIAKILGALPTDLGVSVGNATVAKTAQNYTDLMSQVGLQNNVQDVDRLIRTGSEADLAMSYQGSMDALQTSQQRMQLDAIYQAVKQYRGFDGSHAAGHSFIPFDGYVAELHRGEGVLTASENKAYREMNFASGGNGGTGNEMIAEAVYALAEEIAGLRVDTVSTAMAVASATVKSNEANADTIIKGISATAMKTAFIDKTVPKATYK